MLNLRRAFSDICRGYTTQTWEARAVYVKHLSHHDQIDIDLFHDEALNHALSRGIASEASRLKWLESKGFWTRKNQNELDNHRVFTENLAVTKTKMPVKSQRDEIGRQLDEAQAKLNEMGTKRSALIGLTAEHAASSKVQYEYIRLSLFKDKHCRKPLFDARDIAEMGDEESRRILIFYVNSLDAFGVANIKKIALAPFFTNYFYLCGEQHSSFFTRPVSELTFFQVNLLSYAVSYRNILSNQNVPEQVRDDPVKLEEYVNRSQAVREMSAKAPATGGRVGYVGAQQGDFDDWGMKNDTAQVQQMARGGVSDSMDAARQMGMA